MDLNLLTTFHELIDAGSVAAAARRLGRSQPAISTRLRQLEQALGTPVLEKVGRRLQPTPLGRAVHREVAHMMTSARRIMDLARTVGDAPAGRLRIGALPTVGVHLLAPKIGQLLASPQLEIELTYGLNDALLSDLLRGSLDVVVTVGDRPASTELDVTTIGVVRPVLASRRDLELPKRATAAMIREHTFLGFGRIGDPFFDAIDRFTTREGLSPRVLVSHIDTLKTLATEGVGVAILPDYTVREEPRLRSSEIAELDVAHDLWIAARQSSRELTALRHLAKAMTPSYGSSA